MIVTLLFLVGCNKSNQEEESECELQTSSTVKALDCPEGCFLQFTYYHDLSEEEYPDNYNLSYKLKQKTDNCGLNQLVYYKPTRIYITHIYDKENNLIGAFESEEECQTPIKTHNNITQDCYEIKEEVIFITIQKPKRYLSHGDCV